MSSYGIITSNGGELCHSGTKGTKWGNRRYQNSDGSLTPLGRIHYGIGMARKQRKNDAYIKKLEKKQAAKEKKQASTESTQTKKKSVNEMSNDELDQYITRLQKEKTVKELERSVYGTQMDSTNNKSKESAGKKFVKDVLYTAGKQVATEATKYAMGSAVNKIMGKNVINVKGDKKKKDKDSD